MRGILLFFLATCLLASCSYTSQEEMLQKRIEEGAYVVYWKNKETGFQCQIKGVYDKETAEDIAASKRNLKPENEYWIEQVAIGSKQ
ncbi:hypothetical protein SAMN02745165_00804 [Malonomonas rubra DSM 5091]|uniref:SPOR domain-containing protein n=1 Tax=Malonomonas rubra DSM 5091 TaxID=1122189 RepID=A0A1M6DTX2_MALRU|nr:hypothetical protein [Malonomonas rubra]SHI76652.1 hypothetical protein SAMN02745165_00804 [Malonomonas rubra DSM 5091]